MPSTVGVHVLNEYGPEVVAALTAGRTVAVSDVGQDPRTCHSPVLDAYQSRNIRAYLDVPLMRGGKLISVLFLHVDKPRLWTRDEIRSAEDVAERTWSAVERARAEEALRRSEDEFRTLSENLPSLCWMADTQGSIYWFNRRCCEFSGRTQQELVDGAWQDLHDPAWLPRVVGRWEQSVTAGSPFEMTFPLRSLDGTMRTFLTRVEPLRASDGSISKWFGTNVDVTEQRKIEERLRASETQLRWLERDAGTESCRAHGRPRPHVATFDGHHAGGAIRRHDHRRKSGVDKRVWLARGGAGRRELPGIPAP